MLWENFWMALTLSRKWERNSPFLSSSKTMSKLNQQLFKASEKGDLDELKKLHQKGGDPDWKHPKNCQRNSLQIAAMAGKLEIVKYLVTEVKMKVEEVDSVGKTALDLAWTHNEVEIAGFLKKHRFETSGITIESEIQFVLQSLTPDSPDFSRALASLATLCLDPESRPQAVVAHFPEKLIALFPVLIADESSRARATVNQVATLTRIDSLKAILLEQRGFSKLALAITETSVKTRDNLVISLVFLFSRGRDVRQSMCEIGEKLLDSFIEVLESSDMAAGITLTTAALFPAAKSRNRAIELAKSKMYAEIQNGDPQIRNGALDALMEAAAMEEVRPLLVEQGVKEVLEPFIKEALTEDNFLPSLIQALLSASDVSKNTESGTEPTSPVIIARIIDALDLFATTSKSFIGTAKGYHVDCRGVLLAARSLATNEENLKELSKQDFVMKMVALLQNRKDDLFLTNLAQLEEACYVIWTLSFDKHSKGQLIDANVIELLKSLPLEHSGVRRGVEGALWNLEGSSRPQTSIENQKPSGQVMISYSWYQKGRMRQLASHLKSLGFNVWVDIEQMEGSVLGKMAEAVESSSVIVIGLSSTYKDSQACRTEAEYAYKLKKEIVFVAAEDYFSPKGWLGALLGNHLWYSPWLNGFDTETSTIANVLKKKMDLDSKTALQSWFSTTPPGGGSEVILLLQDALKKIDGLNAKMDSLQSQITSSIKAGEEKEKGIGLNAKLLFFLLGFAGFGLLSRTKLLTRFFK